METEVNLLRQVIAVYENLKTYQDNAMISSGSQTDGFRTYYRNPCFRFEYSDLNFWKDGQPHTVAIPTEYGTSILISDGTNYFLKRFYADESKEIEIERVKGILLRQFSLALLIPWIGTPPGIREVKDPQQQSDIQIHDHNCFVLLGKLFRAGDIEISVEQESFLIRRIRLREWFRQMEQRNIDDRSDLTKFPFSVDITYQDISLEPPENSLFDRT